MTQQRLRQAKNEEGFTILELLVIVLIIGILSAIAVPAYSNQRKKAYDANTVSDARNGATVLSTVLLSEMMSEDPTLTVKGTGISDSETVKMELTVGGASQSKHYTASETLILGQGTRGAAAGTAADFSVCYWNPNGYKYTSPETAAVWRSTEEQGGGTFRSARSDDDCVAAGRALEEGTDSDVTPPAEEEPPPDGVPFNPYYYPVCQEFEGQWFAFQHFINSVSPSGEIVNATWDSDSGNLQITSLSSSFTWSGNYSGFSSRVTSAYARVINSTLRHGNIEYTRSGAFDPMGYCGAGFS